MEEIIDRFDEIAEDYDSFKDSIPGYRSMVKVIEEVMDYYNSERPPKSICELGIGTGEMAGKVIKKYEPDEFVGIDGSSEMIEEAWENLGEIDSGTNLGLKKQKFSNWSPDRKFDWVYSSLAIHHLSDDRKRRLFCRIEDQLNEGGLFLLSDLVKRPEDFLDLYKKTRKKRMLESGFTEEEFEKRWQIHVENDVPAKLEDLLQWFNDLGFESVDLAWKDWNRVIVVCLK